MSAEPVGNQELLFGFRAVAHGQVNPRQKQVCWEIMGVKTQRLLTKIKRFLCLSLQEVNGSDFRLKDTYLETVMV